MQEDELNRSRKTIDTLNSELNEARDQVQGIASESVAQLLQEITNYSNRVLSTEAEEQARQHLTCHNSTT